MDPGCRSLSTAPVQSSSECWGHTLLSHLPAGPCSFTGRGTNQWEWQRALCLITAPWRFSRTSLGSVGLDFRGVWREIRRKLSTLEKLETGVSDPFRRKGVWLSVALGHINAHMQRGHLRIKPPIKRGIECGKHLLWATEVWTAERHG